MIKQSYFINDRVIIFSNVNDMVCVFDMEISEFRDFNKDLIHYQSCLDAIFVHSPSAKVYCLLNKIDKVSADQRNTVFTTVVNQLSGLSKQTNMS